MVQVLYIILVLICHPTFGPPSLLDCMNSIYNYLRSFLGVYRDYALLWSQVGLAPWKL